jgi:acyl-CoA dehydrogenase
VQTMRSVVSEAAREYDALQASPDGIEVLGSMGYVLKINNVKVLVSRTVTEVVAHCLAICGMAGYGNGTKFSLGRHLRDAHGAALMIANDRIQSTNAALLLVHKD